MTPTRTLALSAAAVALLCQSAIAQEVVVTRPQAPAETPSALFTPPASVAAASATPAKVEDEPLPPSAPKEDYEFVGWCAGVLTGHMALFEQVEPTLKEISKRWKSEEVDERSNAAKQKIGRDVLAEFADAMRAAEAASSTAIAPNGVRAIAQGRAMWADIDRVDANARAYSWMNWALPARCQTTAGKLKSRATLMAAALRDNSASAVQTSAVRLVGERPNELAPIAPPVAEPVAVAAVEPTSTEMSEAAAAAAIILAPTTTATVKAAPAPVRTPPAPSPAKAPAARPAVPPSQAAGLR